MSNSIGCLTPLEPLGNGVSCIMFTKKFFEAHQNPSNQIKEIVKLPCQFMNQTHGIQIEDVTGRSDGELIESDGLSTYSNSIGLGVRTADCIPIALSSNDGSHVALLHAGWKGLGLGIVENFQSNFLKAGVQYNAWLGPSIAARNYEVDNRVFDFYCSREPESESNFAGNGHKGKWQFNLKSEAIRRLTKKNIKVSVSEECTVDNEDFFYSHRRNRSNERMVTLIWRSNES